MIPLDAFGVILEGAAATVRSLELSIPFAVICVLLSLWIVNNYLKHSEADRS